jgi:hypothetical protein
LDFSRVHKKLAEANYFFQLLMQQEQCTIGYHREPFDYLLSAFLNATRTVDYRLRHEQGTTYKPWRAAWDATLTPEQRGMMKYMANDRAAEVHRTGSGRSVKKEQVVLRPGRYRTHEGLFDYGDVPGIPPPTVCLDTYNYITDDGTERRATEVCRDYLALLQRMVADFEAANP